MPDEKTKGPHGAPKDDESQPTNPSPDPAGQPAGVGQEEEGGQGENDDDSGVLGPPV